MVRLSPNLAPNDGAPTERVLVVEDYSPFLQSGSQSRRTQTGLDSSRHRTPNTEWNRCCQDHSQRCPESRIIFLTQNQDREIMREALAIDHAGYVLKTNAATELLEAIEAARRNP